MLAIELENYLIKIAEQHILVNDLMKFLCDASN
jgi:hypothetical protein